MTKLKNLLNKVLHILTNINYKIKYDTLRNKYDLLEEKVSHGVYKDLTSILDNTYQIEKYKKENIYLRKQLKEYKREVAELNEEIKEDK